MAFWTGLGFGGGRHANGLVKRMVANHNQCRTSQALPVQGVINGEGSPSEVIAKRGLKVVSDDGALMIAIEAAIAAQPDTAERIRGGNIPAAGALIGAVMKATGGQADAAKVRELLLKHLGQGA